MAEYVGITGIQDGTNGAAVPLRLEIREFIQDPDRLNIYLLALQRMQSLPKTDKLSWYQISGIHGRPYTAWDNVTGNGNSAGYCTHSSILFLPWHRPYLALFEQALYANARAAIAGFPAGADKDKYTRILPSFRIPYWDFAADPVLPDIVVNQKTVEVVSATGKKTINNPLYSYNFGTINKSDFPYPPQSVWLNTLRQPGTGRRPSPNDSSRPQVVASALASFSSTPSFPPRPGRPVLNLRDRVYALLSKNNYQNFQYFSNDGWNNNNNPDDYDSLESIHNNIHVLVGGDGHMSDPGYAGFDPVFWLHHCNVDRIFAIWQVLNPDSYVVDQQAANSTFWSNGTDNPNVDPTIEGPQSDLVPFHQDDSTYWLSETVRDLKVFGSTYPELVDWGVVGPAQVKTNVQAAVQRLYGRTAPIGRLRGGFFSNLASRIAPAKASGDQSNIGIPQNDGPGDEEPHHHHHHHHHHHSHGHAESSSQEPRHHLFDGLIHDDNHYHEYFANLRVEKYALGGSFNVHVFMGSFSDDPVQRVNDDNLVGTFSVFANDPHTTGCGKCKTDAENKLIVTASIPLTGALLDRIPDEAIPELRNLEPEVVIPFLTKELHWRVNKADDEPVSRDEVLSLKVGVASVIVDVPEDPRELPSYRDWKPLYEVTRGRRRGIEDDDDL